MRKIENRIATQCRFDATLYAKLKVIADREHRFSNSQLEYFLEKCIKEYEREHGPIELPDEED